MDKSINAELATFLPGAIKTAIKSYVKFTDLPRGRDLPKNFAEHHAEAAKAISHLKMLLEVADKLGMLEKDEYGLEKIIPLLKNAEDEVRRYHKQFEQNQSKKLTETGLEKINSDEKEQHMPLA